MMRPGGVRTASSPSKHLPTRHFNQTASSTKARATTHRALFASSPFLRQCCDLFHCKRHLPTHNGPQPGPQNSYRCGQTFAVSIAVGNFVAAGWVRHLPPSYVRHAHKIITKFQQMNQHPRIGRSQQKSSHTTVKQKTPANPPHPKQN